MSNILKMNSKKKFNVRVTSNEIEDLATFEDESSKLKEQIKQAYEEGIIEGRNTAVNEMKGNYDMELSENISKMGVVVSEMENRLVQYSKAFEKLVIETSFMISEKIIRRKIEQETIINETLTQAIKKIIGANKFIVKLHPNDIELLNNDSRSLIKEVALNKIKFESDESIEPGGCFIETDIGNADGRISNQLNELKKAFDNSLFANEEDHDN